MVSGCAGYDDGYEDGYEGVSPSVLGRLSRSYESGYEDGADDAYYFDLGCSDAENDESPQFPDIIEYMEGYRECQ